MLNPGNNTTHARAMISAAARSRGQNGAGTQAMLQRFQIEVATVDPNPPRCFRRDQPIGGGLASLRNGFHNGFPLLLHISDLLSRVTDPVGVLEVCQVGSDIADIAITRV